MRILYLNLRKGKEEWERGRSNGVNKLTLKLVEKGRIHGYTSRVRVGRGSDRKGYKGI